MRSLNLFRPVLALGLVVAGVVAVDLSTPIQPFQYDQAAAIILVALVALIGSGLPSCAIRKRIC